MYQLTQLAADRHRERLAAAEAQRLAGRALALARATRRAERAERRLCCAARQVRRLRAQLAPTAVPIRATAGGAALTPAVSRCPLVGGAATGRPIPGPTGRRVRGEGDHDHDC